MNLRVLKIDGRGNADHWATVCVMQAEGLPTTVPGERLGEVLEAEIIAFAGANGYRIAPRGSGVAGEPYADEPWCWPFTDTVLVHQTGGRDT